jgi:hypothetical protein
VRALRELQEAFGRALVDPAQASVLADVVGDGIGAARRLQVYRNNVFSSLGAALGAIYPVVERLVGEGFFRFAAHGYVRRVPSRSGNIHEFGRSFPEFLGELPQARGLPYLLDVARLEWAYHEVFHGADHPPLEPRRLAAVPAEEWVALRLRLHPAGRLLASPYPVLHIWAVNQEGFAGDATVDLAEGASRVLVVRPRESVELWPLGPGEHALLGALERSRTLVEAVDRALAVEPDLDAVATLTRHVAAGTLVEARSGASPRGVGPGDVSRRGRRSAPRSD